MAPPFLGARSRDHRSSRPGAGFPVSSGVVGTSGAGSATGAGVRGGSGVGAAVMSRAAACSAWLFIQSRTP
ncbi:hypothetical protein, partial [Corallococcus sp. AB018]|uniref:hypothetical protein n=1 Tax=Corallococcus sp. AB018 TaxID=2316715 RepID=UPI001F1E6F53